MDFRLVLKALEAAALISSSSLSPTAKEFDAEFASRKTMDFMLNSQPHEVGVLGLAIPTVKTMSGYLNRLYKMGFLNRRRVAREVKTRTGKKCKRGFKYVYRFSKQGRQYLDYMRNPKPPLPPLYGQTLEDVFTIESLRQSLLDDLKENATRINFAMFRGFNGRGRYRRFSDRGASRSGHACRQVRRMLREKDKEILRLQEQLEKLTYARRW